MDFVKTLELPGKFTSPVWNLLKIKNNCFKLHVFQQLNISIIIIYLEYILYNYRSYIVIVKIKSHFCIQLNYLR